MIVVDSSAVIAILRREAESDHYLRIIADAPSSLLSAVSVLEISMVLAGRMLGQDAWVELDMLLVQAEVNIVSHDEQLASLARIAFLRYGKGRHPASLNFGECATYASAKSRGLPLLFKGHDFSQTDLTAAI